MANIQIDIKIKKNKEEEMLNKIRETEGIDWDRIFDMDSPEITTSAEGKKLTIAFDDNYDEAEWYKFLNLIAPYIKDGEYIECRGDDFTTWVWYKKKGEWYETSYKQIIDRKLAHKI